MTKIFTMQEQIENFIEKNEAFLVIYKNNIYDVTEYVECHPGQKYCCIIFLGGEDIFAEYNGMDISTIFHGDDDQHIHSAKALKKLQKYKIGVFTPNYENKQNQINYTQISSKEEENTANTLQFTINEQKPILSQISQFSRSSYKHFIDSQDHYQNQQIFDKQFLDKIFGPNF